MFLKGLRYIGIGALFYWGMISFLVIFGILPAFKEICTITQHPYYQDCATYDVAFYIILRVMLFLDNHNWIAIFVATGVIAFYTWQLRISTEKLWDAGERQLFHIKESNQRELRAYLGVIDINFNKETQVASAVIKNFGKTPAYEVIQYITCVLTEPLNSGESPEIDLTEILDKGSRNNIWPGDTTNIHSPLLNKSGEILEKLQISDWKIITAGKRMIYLTGKVRYSDVFGSEWITEYRHMLGGEIGITAFAACREGNKAT